MASGSSKPLFKPSTSEGVFSSPRSSSSNDSKPDDSETETKHAAVADTLHKPFDCGVWSLGEPYKDPNKVKAALDKLGAFVLESDDCPLALIDSDGGLFDSEEEAEAVPRPPIDLRELKELRLNDVVSPTAELDSESEVDSESTLIEEISDGVFESRDDEGVQVDEHRAKRKRKSFVQRSNFVKQNLKRKRKPVPRKRTRFVQKPKASTDPAKPNPPNNALLNV